MAGDPAAARIALGAAERAPGLWWNALGSPELDSAIRQALDGNPSLAEANATLQRLEEEANAERGNRAVQAGYTADASRRRINTTTFGISGFPSPTRSIFSVGGTVSYDLDLWGGGRRAVEAAEARVQRQARLGDAAYLTLTGNVALQAVRIAALRAQIATIESVIADDRRMIAMVDAAERAGGQPASASTAGETQLAQDLALLPPLQRELSQARHQMALLVGRAPADWTAPDFSLAGFTLPAQVPVTLPSTLVRNRPDILAAEAELHAATAQIGVARAAQFPNISLSASLTQTALNPGDLFGYSASGWNIGPSIAGPLLNGGRLAAQRRAAEAEARASMARYQGTVLRAFVQVSDLLSNLAHDDEAIAAYRRASAAAESNLTDARAAYRLGGGTLLAVIDAQRSVNRSRRDLAIAQGQRLSDLVELYVALGSSVRS
jgi:NodT family efflux transporter outer membrane factor (OMF) lipoprotein